MTKNDNVFLRVLSSKPALFLELALLAFFSFNLGKEMLKKNALEKEVLSLQEELSQLDKDKSELSELLNYVQTDAFAELEAREKLNLAKAGENLIVIPSADGGTQAVAGQKEENAASGNSAGKKNNLVRWWQYFFAEDKLWLD